MLVRQTPFWPPKNPKALCGKGFDAKKGNIANLDYSANAFSRMRQICFFPLSYHPYEGNQRGCSSDQPLWGPQVGQNYLQGPTQIHFCLLSSLLSSGFFLFCWINPRLPILWWYLTHPSPQGLLQKPQTNLECHQDNKISHSWCCHG